jgi:hypothetical protein
LINGKIETIVLLFRVYCSTVHNRIVVHAMEKKER